MKTKVFVFATISLMLCGAAIAQQSSNDEIVSIPKSKLTADQLQQIQQENLQKRIDTYGKWVGIGKEVGVAVNSSLEAITNQADHFSQTGVGKFTMVIVAWKVIGDQLIHVVGGLLEILIILPIWIWSYRKFCTSHRVLVKKEAGFWGAKEYHTTELESDGDVFWGHWIAAFFLLLVVLLTVFSY